MSPMRAVLMFCQGCEWESAAWEVEETVALSALHVDLNPDHTILIRLLNADDALLHWQRQAAGPDTPEVDR